MHLGLASKILPVVLFACLLAFPISPVFANVEMASTSVLIVEGSPEPEPEAPPSDPPRSANGGGGGTIIEGVKILSIEVFQDESKNVHITWETNRPTRNSFWYGLTEKFEIDSIWEQKYSVFHEVILPHIFYDRLYYFQIFAQTPKGSSATRQSFFMFHTTVEPPLSVPSTTPSSSIPQPPAVPQTVPEETSPPEIPRVEIGPPIDTEILIPGDTIESPGSKETSSPSGQPTSSVILKPDVVSSSSSTIPETGASSTQSVSLQERNNVSTPSEKKSVLRIYWDPFFGEYGGLSFVPIVWTTLFAPLSIFYHSLFWPIWFLLF